MLQLIHTGVAAEWSEVELSGMEWRRVARSGVERSGMEWCGVEWSGVDWSGVVWTEVESGEWRVESGESSG